MIVVTAAGGRTGTAVVRALRGRGEHVRAVVSRRPRDCTGHLAGPPSGDPR